MNRVHQRFLGAVAMLGHLCALYDKGVFEAGRLMSNLIFQLSVNRKGTNISLIQQAGLSEELRIVVDRQTLSSRLAADASMSPLVSLIFGVRDARTGAPVPAAIWLPAVLKPDPIDEFAELSIDEWLDDPVIPTTHEKLSRRKLIVAVRDQGGGAHSDPDPKLQKSIAYVDLVDSFPISRLSAVEIRGKVTLVRDLLPPVTMPLLRQIAHELLSAIYSQTDVRNCFHLSTLVCLFRGTELQGAFVPEGYPNIGPVHGKSPRIVARTKEDEGSNAAR